jgi:hypothetical protein
MSAQPLTTGSEIAAYVVAHIIGIVSTYVFNPMIFAMLSSPDHRGMIPAVAFGLSLVTMTIVLLLFLALRRALANT